MDIDFDIDCPECGRTIKVTTTEVARGATKRCPAGHTIKLVDQGGGARQVRRSMDELDRAIKRLGK